MYIAIISIEKSEISGKRKEVTVDFRVKGNYINNTECNWYHCSGEFISGLIILIDQLEDIHRWHNSSAPELIYVEIGGK